MIPIVTPQGQPLNWNVNANSFGGTLVINQIDANDSSLQGVIFGDSIRGFWDEVAQKITFIRIPNNNDAAQSQIYTAYLFQNQNGPLDTIFTLAGYFEALSAPAGGTAQRNLFGWFAQATIHIDV